MKYCDFSLASESTESPPGCFSTRAILCCGNAPAIKQISLDRPHEKE